MGIEFVHGQLLFPFYLLLLYITILSNHYRFILINRKRQQGNCLLVTSLVNQVLY